MATAFLRNMYRPRRILLGTIGLTLFLLPLVFSFQTYQVFEINKFVVFVWGNSLCLLLFGIFTLFPKTSFPLQRFSKYQRIFFSIFALFLIFSGISGIFGHAPMRSFFGSDVRHFGFLTWMHLFLFCWLICALRPSKQEQQVFFFLPILATAVLQVVFAIIQYFHPQFLFGALQIGESTWRSFGTMGYPNFLAQFLLLPFFLSCGYRIQALRNKNKRLAWGGMILVFVFWIGMLLTQSRAGLFAAFAGSMFLVFVSLRHTSIGSRKRLLAVYGAIATMLALVFLYIFFFSNTFVLNSANRVVSVESRISVWKNTIPILSERPFLGVGFENFSTAFAPHFPRELLSLENLKTTIDRSHNVFLDLLIHTGILGFVCFVALLAAVVAAFRKRKKDPFQIALGSTFVAILASWQFGFPVIVDAVLFFLICALICSENSSSANRAPQRLWTLSLALFAIFSLGLSGILWRAEKHFLSAVSQKDTTALFDVAKDFSWKERYVFPAIRPLEREGKNEEAEALLHDFLQQNPFSGEGYARLASHLTRVGGDFFAAEKAFQKAERLAPISSEVYGHPRSD